MTDWQIVVIKCIAWMMIAMFSLGILDTIITEWYKEWRRKRNLNKRRVWNDTSSS